MSTPSEQLNQIRETLFRLNTIATREEPMSYIERTNMQKDMKEAGANLTRLEVALATQEGMRDVGT